MTHVRGSRRPDRADAGDRQQRHHGLRNVRHVGNHPVAFLDAHALERVGQSRHLALEFTPGDLGIGPQFGFEDDRRPFVHRVAQGVFGIVQARTFEPDRARHLALLQNLLVGGGRLDCVVLPDAGPERLDLVYRPLPQGVVVGEFEAAVLLEPCHVGGEPRAFEALRGRLPEQGAFFGWGHDGLAGGVRGSILSRQARAVGPA